MSIEQGMMIIAVVSFATTFVFGKIKSKFFRVAAHLLLPLFLAIALYWGPNLKSIGNAEHKAWAILFISAFYASGLCGSFLAFIMNMISRKISSTDHGRNNQRGM